MRYNEIFERRSTPMKTKQLMSASNDRTIGFEIEFYANHKEFKTKDMIEREKEKIKEDYPLRSFILENKWHPSNTIRMITIENYNLEPKYGIVSPRQYYEKLEDENPGYYEEVRKLKKQFEEEFDNMSVEEKAQFLQKLYNKAGLDENNSPSSPSDFLKRKVKITSKERLYADIELLFELEEDLQLPENQGTEESLEFIKDSKDNIVFLEDIEYDDLRKYFTEESVDNFEDEMRKSYEEYVKNVATKRIDDPSSIYKEIIRTFEDDYGYNDVTKIGANEKKTDSETWSITRDASLRIEDGYELVSPVFNSVEKGIKELSTILNIIKRDKRFYTNEDTGLHINIGGIDNLDALKFLLFVDENSILRYFGRKGNKNAKEILENIYDTISKTSISLKRYDELILSMNNIIFDNKDKFNFLNLVPLQHHGFIEIRGMGGKNYERKIDSITKYIRKIAYALDIAEDPQKEKDVYLKKLSKIVNTADNDSSQQRIKKGIDPLTRDEVEKFTKLYKSYVYNKDDAVLESIHTIYDLKRDFDSFLRTMVRISRTIGKNENVDTIILRVIFKIFLKLINNQNKNKLSKYYDDLKTINEKQITNDDIKYLNETYLIPRLEKLISTDNE